MCQISQKIHRRSLRNSQAPQPLFRGAMLAYDVIKETVIL